ncbi:hypothetical protein [Candidatus Nitrososphaera evergladensis]|uniref:hypothetical protein n=1 Tax=Candidatus Nitrososphaera evergladensis TaxID=1459637 RepID=UPI00130EA7A6|nr:hypothetical protein [Candidatus Nitrososphaera evergladensis]
MPEGKNNCQRALVFQGGGALGAYEAGTYQQIYKKSAKRKTLPTIVDCLTSSQALR